MKGALVAGVLAALALTVVVVESLECVECHIPGSVCSVNATACSSSDARSCVDSFVNSTLGGSNSLYQNKFCSAENCSTTNPNVAFTVNVSDGQSFYFASQCCQGGACTNSSSDSEPSNTLGNNTECPACYGNNSANCNETTIQCDKQCVYIIATFTNASDTENKTVELKGCSDIDSSTCEFLSAGNQTVGEVIFQKVECSNVPTENSTTEISSTPNTTASQTPTTTSQTTTRSSSAGAKASLSSLALAGLLLKLQL